jgi:hypothetical protein
LFGIRVSWLYARGRQILWGRPREAKEKFDPARGISSYQGRRWVNAASITIDSVEPLPASDVNAEVSFVVRWTTGVGDARASHSGKWEANLKKARRRTFSRDASRSPFGGQLD